VVDGAAPFEIWNVGVCGFLVEMTSGMPKARLDVFERRVGRNSID
jgi:hypothetical protein